MTTLHELTNSREFDSYISDRLGNDLFINDPERADRIHEAAKHGSDGSTHAEHIGDWRDFLTTIDLPDADREAIETEINACEEWHKANGSLDTTCG